MIHIKVVNKVDFDVFENIDVVKCINVLFELALSNALIFYVTIINKHTTLVQYHEGKKIELILYISEVSCDLMHNPRIYHYR